MLYHRHRFLPNQAHHIGRALMRNKKKNKQPWKVKQLSLAMDGDILAAYAKAAKDPFPRNAALLRKVLEAILKRFPVPERQQILQRLQYISACEGNKLLDVEVRSTIESLSVFTPCRDKRSHDRIVLMRQKAVLQRYVYGVAPYPKESKARTSWIKRHARVIWGITADPCLCEYAPWSSDTISALSGSSPNELIEKILAFIHQMSISALRQWLKRSQSEEKDWHGPLIIPKKLAKLYGFKRKPGKTEDGLVEYEFPPGLDSFEIYVDAMGKLLRLEAKKSDMRTHSVKD